MEESQNGFAIEEILGEQKVLELKCKLYGIQYEIVDIKLSDEMRTKKINDKTIYEHVMNNWPVTTGLF